MKKPAGPASVRVAIYARVSTSDQSCSQQLHELRQYAAARGWEVEGEYVDDAVSGAKTSRPQLDKLMSAARRRQIDAVVCVKLDRWGRSMPHAVGSIQELAALGVRFIATSQGIDTDQGNPTARLMLNLLACFAEFEREIISERTRAGLAKARRDGKTLGRKRLVVDRKRVAALKAQGLSVRAIAGKLGISVGTAQNVIKAL